MNQRPESQPLPTAPGATRLSQLLQQASAELRAEPAPAMAARVLAALPATRHAASAPVKPAKRPVPIPPAPVSAAPQPTSPGGPATLAARRATPGWPLLATVSAAFGLLLVAATTLVMLAPPPDEGAAGRTLAQGGFTPLVDAERWQRLAQEEGAAWVVNAELQQQRLASFGLPFDPGRAAEPVRAELLMRASGEVLAVRVLR